MEENLQIKPLTSLTGIVAMFLPMERFIEPIIRSKGIEVLHQVVLQVDEGGDVEVLMSFFKNIGTVVDMHPGEVKNFQCYVISVSANSKSKVLNLLKREDLFLIIINQGIVPAYLSDYSVFQLDNRLLKEEAEFLVSEAKKFMDYARKNPHLVLQTLDIFITSTWYIEHKYTSTLDVSLHVILETYRAYYRSEHCEADTADWMEILEAGVEAIISRTEGIGYDVVQPMRALANEYLEAHPEVMFCDIEEIEGQIVKALEYGQAILYDDAWYYFPERLFRSMCEPLRDIVPLTEIKNRMLDEGYLGCDKGGTSGFTVKKVIVTAYGQRVRMRFLKILRNLVVEDGSLALEERRCEECTSGWPMENEGAMSQGTLPTTLC